MKSKGQKRLRVAFIAVFLLVIGGTALWCWLAPKKPALGPGAACPPVRTSLAVLALAENPTARTYAAFGPGAGAFTNVFEHAGLVSLANAAARADRVSVSGASAARADRVSVSGASAARADRVSVSGESGGAGIVFVSGESANGAICRWKECGATNGILAIHFDVRKKTFKAFQRELAALPETWSWRLWFPGRSDALVTVDVDAESLPRQNKDGSSSSDANRFRVNGDANRFRVYGLPRLSDLLDLFAREGLFADLARAGIDSLPVLFASYAGDRKTVMPVFDFAQGEVVPECFVTRDIPSFDWIDASGVDADIREPLLSEIRSMQVIRRMVLQGDIHSRAGKMDAAMDAWTKAIKRNPNDSLILERICLLDVNAETFMKVGNFQMAAQCLETMVCLRPKDVATMRRLTRVLQQMGKKEMAAVVSKRADEIVKGRLSVGAAARRANTKERVPNAGAAGRRTYEGSPVTTTKRETE